MDDKLKPIGPVPQVPPPDAMDDEDEEYIPFTADPTSPNVQALAAIIGWDRVRQIAADEAEALREQEEENE